MDYNLTTRTLYFQTLAASDVEVKGWIRNGAKVKEYTVCCARGGVFPEIEAHTELSLLTVRHAVHLLYLCRPCLKANMTPYQEVKMVDNELFSYKSRDMITKIRMQWLHYEHSIMGTLCHICDIQMLDLSFRSPLLILTILEFDNIRFCNNTVCPACVLFISIVMLVGLTPVANAKLISCTRQNLHCVTM